MDGRIECACDGWDVPQRMNLTLDTNISGWLLVEARLGRHCQYSSPSLLIRRASDPDNPVNILLPVIGDGWIAELVEVPSDAMELRLQLPEREQPRSPGFSVRGVPWLERNVRMAHRVRATYGALSKDSRKNIGLSYLKAVLDLRQAYRIATQHGPTLQADPYPGWNARFCALSDYDRRAIVRHIARIAPRPRFHVLVTAEDATPHALRTTLASLGRQLYPEFTCTLLGANDALDKREGAEFGWTGGGRKLGVVPIDAIGNWLAAFNNSLSGERTGDWVMLLCAGDSLPEHALYWYATEISRHADAAIFYSDDDQLDGEGRPSVPQFKPDWSLAHVRSKDYVGQAAIFRGGAVAAACGLNLDCLRRGNFDLLLRVIDAVGEKIEHVPAVLFHRRAPGEVQDQGTRYRVQGGTPQTEIQDEWGEPGWCVEKLREHLERNGIDAEVSETLLGYRRVKYRLPETVPLVSIIVPTRDRVELLRQCVESVLGKTTYPAFELLIVDNQSADADALAYLDELAGRPRARVLRYDRPFNYSAINNFAARQAQGEILCLLNNDTEVISRDWLEEMVGHLLQEQVGAVGARLLYTDGRVQHGGVTVGPGGCADHLHSELPRSHPGYYQRAVIAQELSAVTAACMLTWKHLYEQLGGLNEKALPVAFNDVDYCLRLQEVGYRVIYTPHAELYHHEWATRGVDTTWRQRWRARREINYMRSRWRERMKNDPYYNPNLSYDQPNFTLNWKPRVAKPWR